MIPRIFEIIKDMALVLMKHAELERQEIKRGLGIYPQDSTSHIHIQRKGDEKNE